MDDSFEEWREAIAAKQRFQSNGGETMQYARTTSAASYHHVLIREWRLEKEGNFERRKQDFRDYFKKHPHILRNERGRVNPNTKLCL